MILGTPAYMSPEQAGGRPVDHRSDLFSLGCVLYRLATRRPPFEGSDPISTLVAVASAQPSPPCVVDPSVPLELSLLIMKLLEKDPSNRPASARAVADALATIERTSSLVAAPPPTAVPRASTVATAKRAAGTRAHAAADPAAQRGVGMSQSLRRLRGRDPPPSHTFRGRNCHAGVQGAADGDQRRHGGDEAAE